MPPTSAILFLATRMPYRLFGRALAVTFVLGCTPVTGTEPSSPLAATVPIKGCAADGKLINTVEATPSNGVTPSRIDDWEDNMVAYGRRLGDQMMAESEFSARLPMNYYDGQRVFLQIAEYTGEEEPWHTYADVAEATYKEYLENSNFRPAGWMRFPHGLFMDWQRTGDAQSRQYLLYLRDRGPFSNPEQGDHRKQWRKARYAREVAYSLETQILAERAGAPPQVARVDLYVDMALEHIDAWVTGDFSHSDPRWRMCQAFMAGLTASALIAYDDHLVTTGRGRDPRVLPRLRLLADWLWQTMWIAGVGGNGGDWYPYEGASYGAFEYVQPTVEEEGSESPAPDLNLLVAPLYGWLWHQTGAPRFRNRGDAIFNGGVEMASLKGGKHFNQNYRSSFDYVTWRKHTDADAAQ